MDGNDGLDDTAAAERRLRPQPAVHPGLAGWEATVDEAADHGAPAVRCDPSHYGLDPTGPEVRVLAAAGGATQLPLMIAVRLADVRHRHPNDRAGELPAAAGRA